MNDLKKDLLELNPDAFQKQFPKQPFLINHHLVNHPLFVIDRLLELSKALPESCVEYNEGNIPLNMDYKASPRNGLSAEETIRRIRDAHSWMVLKFVENDKEYKALLDQCLDQVYGLSKAIVPGMYAKSGFIFLSSPNSTTPFHVDPEHNFLLQIQGQKTVCQFDPTDATVATEADIERGLYGKVRNLTYKEEFKARGQLFDLTPGKGLHFPVAAPHWVKNGPDVSISFSITFASEYSERLAALRHVNAGLRQYGIQPKPLDHSPVVDNLKYQTYRAVRRVSRIFQS